jgi:hypothetical protein
MSCPVFHGIIIPGMLLLSINVTIDLHINNCTALSVKILDNVPQCTPYSNFFLYPCAINYLKVYTFSLST